MTRDNFLQHFGHFIDASNGIQKLRELILQLAVQGKLVPQDPNDEPASELLKRIQAEKARLVAEGKIKRQKPLPAISEEEKPFELPEGWELSQLGEVVEIVRGITFPASEKSKTPEQGRVACLRTANVQDQLEWDDILFIRDEFISRDDQYLQPFDIVMSMANSRDLVGKVALANSIPLEKVTFGGFLGILRTLLIEPRFVMALLKTPSSRSKLIDSASQTTNIANIGIGKLRPLLVMLPPLAEQRRIVAKVDELMALCDQLEAGRNTRETTHQQLIRAIHQPLTEAADATATQTAWHRIRHNFSNLYTTLESVQALRQTILQLAVRGKLVPQDPSDEPASELLKRIQAEKAKLVAEGKIKKDKPLPEISEDEKPFDLPDGWEWVRFGSLMPDFQNGASSRGDKEGDEITVLRLADIKNWKVSFSEIRKLRMSLASISKYSLKRNDILLIRVNGSADFVGRFVLCEDDYDAIYCDHFIRLRFPIEVVAPTYLNLLGSSSLIRNRIQGLFVSTAGQKTINQKHISSLVFALPPEVEQHRIVAKVDELKALCDQLETNIRTKDETASRYAEAVVQELAA